MPEVFSSEIVETGTGLYDMACPFPITAAGPAEYGVFKPIRVSVYQGILSTEVTVASQKADHA